MHHQHILRYNNFIGLESLLVRILSTRSSLSSYELLSQHLGFDQWMDSPSDLSVCSKCKVSPLSNGLQAGIHASMIRFWKRHLL